MTEVHLKDVQRQREFPTKVIQWFQAQVQKRVITAALNSGRPLSMPWPLRLLLHIPIVRDLPSRVIAHGVRPVHLDPKISYGAEA